MELNNKKSDCGDVSAKTLPLCTGINITPAGVKVPIVAKVPVVLAERDIQIDVEACITLGHPIYEIKRIKKDIFLTQCKLLPRAGVIKNNVPETGKLFISGFVRKNIEYATAECAEKGIVKGDIKHITVDVPFTCVTEVEYVTPPIINLRSFPREVDLLCNKPSDCQTCEKDFQGPIQCENDFEDFIYYNEKPYCELIQARIIEEDIQRDAEKMYGVTVYNKIIENMVIFLRIKVLQLQQVNIGC
jgi:hypothetical protein